MLGGRLYPRTGHTGGVRRSGAGTGSSRVRVADRDLRVGLERPPVGALHHTGGKLTSVKDPRTGLVTGYGYGASNELTSLTPPGLTPFTLTYSGSTTEPLRVRSVTRANPTGGGTATLARYVYGVVPAAANAITGSTVPDLSTSTATSSLWGQDTSPTYVAAVFGQDYTGPDPTVAGATGIDWRYADLSYTDGQGFTTNTAAYGTGRWLYTYNRYDDLGNVVFALDENGTSRMIDDAAANPGAAFSETPYGTTTIYNQETRTAARTGVPKNLSAGAVVTDTYEPARDVILPDGTPGYRRPRAHTDYDQNAPLSGLNPKTGATIGDQTGWSLPTTVTVYAADSAENEPPAAAADFGPVISRTITGYDPKAGATNAGTDPTSGWVLGQATSSTTDMDLDGAATSPTDITTLTYYDALGRVVEKRQPESSGSDAGTTLTGYYRADVVSTDACYSQAWAGLTCTTEPAAQPTGGSTKTVPTTKTSGYSYLLAPAKTDETSGTATRTKTTTFDAAGRAITAATTVTGLTTSTPVPDTTTTYDATNGLVTAVVSGTGANPPTNSTAYDAWGRVIQTTNQLGDTTDTAYDMGGRVDTVTDKLGRTQYFYDGSGTNGLDAASKLERRGKVTKLTVSRKTAALSTASDLLTYTAAYDASGALTTQTLPGKLSQTGSYDTVGQLTGLSYSGQVTSYTETLDANNNPVYTPGAVDPDGVWLAWTVARDTNGRIVTDATGPAAAFDGNPYVGVGNPTERAYTYDQAGRLTKAIDQTSEPVAGSTDATQVTTCTVRTYTFDRNGNRTASSAAAHSDGDCTGATGVTTTPASYGYDQADRPKLDAAGAAYVYDELGRQATLPAADAPDASKGNITLGYYDTDLARLITQGGTSTAFTLDAADRRLTSVTGPTTNGDAPASGTAGSTTTTRHYTDDSDNPAWTETTPAGSGTTLTRYTESISGDLGAQINANTTNDATYGAATLSLANIHGDNVTTVEIPAGTSEATPAVCIGAWANYTEYGLPTIGTTPAATAAIGGSIGYGWLGAKQRATTSDTAGLTLMGVRLYNNRRGTFTSPDPVAGGNTTAYTYPQDPIGAFDLDGNFAIALAPLWWAGAAVIAWAGSRAMSSRCQRGCSISLPSFRAKRTDSRDLFGGNYTNPSAWSRGTSHVARSRYAEVNTAFGMGILAFAKKKKLPAKGRGGGGHGSNVRGSTSDKHTKADGVWGGSAHSSKP